MSFRRSSSRARVRRDRWFVVCTAIVGVLVVGTASAGDQTKSLADALTRELDLVRSSTEIRRAWVLLGRDRASMAYTQTILEHACGESMRRWSVHRSTRDRLDRRTKGRVRRLDGLVREGGTPLLLDGDANARHERIGQVRALEQVVLHDLRELSGVARASRREVDEFVATAREMQALGAVAQVLPLQEQVLREASRTLDSRVSDARHARERRAEAVSPRQRGIHAELFAEVHRAHQELRVAGKNATLVRPVPGGVVGSFGPYTDPVVRVPMHRDGVELRASVGTEVRAMAAGQVVHTGPLPGFEHVVAIEHDDGRWSLTGRLWQIQVSEGQRVAAGEILGTVATKTHDDGLGPSVYVELRHGERPIDPMPALDASR